LPRRRVQPGVMAGIKAIGEAGPYLTPEEEERQAAWYEAHRRELYRQLGLRRFERVLEVGCGSGVVTGELARRAARGAVGVDRRLDVLRAARGRRAGARLALPFRDGVFDAVAVAFVLVWLAKPAAFLNEAGRVLKADGVFVALAEPDYEGAIDYPPAASTREEVARAVREWGGEPAAGRKLPAFLSRAGFDVFSLGVLNSAWTGARWAVEEKRELKLLETLLEPTTGRGRLPSAARARAKAISKGDRCYFLPIFYAAARKVR